ncbi:MAG TPA: M20/M25/M40 family metallo-hydrolase [Gemmatimonadales bacterium]|nr:M20/M25/M40 family metallo-hydrolase [Gemmatimonadales bacterium]
MSAPGRTRVDAPADTASLMATVRVLAADSMEGRRAATPGGARARRYLLGRLQELGVAPLEGSRTQSFPLPTDSGVNLLGVIPGTDTGAPYFVLSAHYDHLGVQKGVIYNGADDNASGVAAVLAVAGALRKNPLSHPVIIALFDAEEGGLRGARAFVTAGPVPRERIAFNINLDMVGHSEAGVLWAAGASHTPALRPLLDSLAATAPVTLKLGHDRGGIPGEQDWSGSSDHGAFHSAGIPFLYFGVEDHQDYHKPSDDPETLTPKFFGGAVSVIETALRALDKMIR